MSNKRIGFEFLIILVAILLAAGIWWWKDHEASQAVEAAETAQRQAVAQITADGESWARSLAISESQAAFRAFAAGIQPLILSGNTETLNQAVGGLLELPGIDFVHILGDGGAVLASSDRKLTTTGQLDADSTWVLETSKVVEREGDAPGTREIAAPVVGAAGPRAYLWMGYDTGSLLSQTRPADWPAAAEVPAQ